MPPVLVLVACRHAWKANGRHHSAPSPDCLQHEPFTSLGKAIRPPRPPRSIVSVKSTRCEAERTPDAGKRRPRTSTP
eukprot:scaffold207187_cov52-Prasinocladus_malaysianus.AAC.1